MAKNPISPYPQTPEGIREYQKVQPFPENPTEKQKRSQTTLSWSLTKDLVYTRDNGTCNICGERVEFKFYDCGHIVDRVCGGTDRLENLVCMCNYCNQRIKPLHETAEAYHQWNINYSPTENKHFNDILEIIKENPHLLENLKNP